MSFVKCFDIVEMVTDEATKQFGSLVQVNYEVKENLRHCCEMIDSFSQQFGGVSYEVDIDDNTMDITISVVCEEFETTLMSSKFSLLAENSKKISFLTAEEDLIKVQFVFDGIWGKSF